jgi:hypothetical protein
MLEKAKVHALPTTDTGHNPIMLYGNKEATKWWITPRSGQAYHLYFTSDKEIKTDDWYLAYDNTLCRRYASKTVEGDRKIVATTNPELWSKTTFNMIGGGVRTQTESTGIHKIPTDFIEAFVREQGIWEVMLEVEQNILTEPTTHDGNLTSKIIGMSKKYKLNSQGAVVVYPIKEKVYTKAQVIYFANYIQANAYLKHNVAELLNVFTFPK